MSHSSSPCDSYDSDYDPSEHLALDTQPQAEREITPEREISSARIASLSPPLSTIVLSPSCSLRPTGSAYYYIGSSPSDPYTASQNDDARISDHAVLGRERCEFRNRMNLQLQSVQNLTEPIASLQIGVEWIQEVPDGARDAGRTAWYLALSAGSLTLV
ncbi:hypothetical protein Tco_0860533 [Tanacetum coccineum]|uniref:Uncharacterized protein n=1 Tax=Tanacetum coccineum TaxID=301880 RepID=A0ABQ5BF67_9ASTR